MVTRDERAKTNMKTNTINAVLIRNNGQTVTFQSSTWKHAGETSLREIDRVDDDAHRFARFFFSTGDALQEYNVNELNEMTDGSWDR